MSDLESNNPAKIEISMAILEREKTRKRYFFLHGLYKLGNDEEEYSMPEYYQVADPGITISYRNHVWSIHDGTTLFYTNQNKTSRPPEKGWILRNGSIDYNLVFILP